MPTRVAVGNNKYCYTGPTCSIHGQHWSKAAEEKLNTAKKKLEDARTYEEFTAVRAEIDAAQAEYDLTSDGYTKLAERKNDEYTDELRARFAQARQDRTTSENTAVQEFLTSKTPAQRAAEVFKTNDQEKITLYLNDTDETVRANLALNKNLKIGQLNKLGFTDSERVQTNVILNKKTSPAILKHLAKEGKTEVVKELAKVQIQAREQEARKAAERKAKKEQKAQETAAYYRSYSYSGKGGGK
jgi:hypothetical protein